VHGDFSVRKYKLIFSSGNISNYFIYSKKDKKSLLDKSWTHYSFIINFLNPGIATYIF